VSNDRSRWVTTKPGIRPGGRGHRAARAEATPARPDGNRTVGSPVGVAVRNGDRMARTLGKGVQLGLNASLLESRTQGRLGA
jgi:hypothetical protein